MQTSHSKPLYRAIENCFYNIGSLLPMINPILISFHFSHASMIIKVYNKVIDGLNRIFLI